MGPGEMLVDADWARARLDDPAAALAAADGQEIKRTQRPLRCRCRHGRDAHRHHRAGSDCALCKCPRWSPSNPVLRLARRWAR
jgi:hypothetical protein